MLSMRASDATLVNVLLTKHTLLRVAWQRVEDGRNCFAEFEGRSQV